MRKRRISGKTFYDGDSAFNDGRVTSSFFCSYIAATWGKNDGSECIFKKYTDYTQDFVRRDESEGVFTGGSGVGDGFGCDMHEYGNFYYTKRVLRFPNHEEIS